MYLSYLLLFGVSVVLLSFHSLFVSEPLAPSSAWPGAAFPEYNITNTDTIKYNIIPIILIRIEYNGI